MQSRDDIREKNTLPPAPGETPSSPLGVVSAFAAFVIWGILPVFWKALDTVNSFEILCHRIVWSLCFLTPFMFFNGRLGELAVFLRNPRNAIAISLNGFLLAANWLLFIWAIGNNMMLETSLGYYINPLVNIMFGIVIFREKASRLVIAAICLAVLGVLYQVLLLGHLPLVPLGLAFSFGIYGLLRKILKVQALPGLFVETMVVMPFAAAYLLWQGHLGQSAFLSGDLFTDSLLVGSGIVTTIPLLMFAYGTKRIRMTTLGLLQYVNPSCVFLLGVFVYGEPLTFDGLVTFACIWAALALYTWDSIRQRHRMQAARTLSRG